MKKTMRVLTMLFLLLASNGLFAQQFSITPEKPAAGDKITINYNPNGGPLEKTSFEGFAFVFELGKQEATAFDLDFSGQGDARSASFQIPANASIVLFSLSNEEEEKMDDNGGTGYKTLVYKADHATPVPGALAWKSMFYNGSGKMGGVKNDLEKSLNLAKQEAEAYPVSLSDLRFATHFATLGKKQQDESMIAASKAQIEKLTKNKKTTEAELRTAFSIATALEDKTLAEAIKKQTDTKFPNGLVAKTKAQDDFKAAKTLPEKLKIYSDAKMKFGKEKDMERSFNAWASNIATEYANAGDWANFEKYLGQISDRTRAAGVLNNLAWPMSGESIEGEASNAAKGMELSAKSLALLEQEAADLASKPASVSTKKWRNNLEFTKAMYGDTYALLLYKNGKYAEALKYQTMACEKNSFEDGDMNERYAVYYEKENSAKETEQMLANLIAEGKANSNMLAQHKRLFMANNSLEQAYDKYLVGLEKEAKAKKRKEIEGKMLNEVAPSFTLRNLKGEEVSLESLRGKVVVLDFWATWCGPCKASFPGMQMAVNKYADRKDVAFLFLDTWENAGDKTKAAGDFIASKSYTFNVLMDLENEVVSKYGVSGIPTKFVVDGNGRIRFKAVGFNGNDQELVDELSTMIELAGGGVTP